MFASFDNRDIVFRYRETWLVTILLHEMRFFPSRVSCSVSLSVISPRFNLLKTRDKCILLSNIRPCGVCTLHTQHTFTPVSYCDLTFVPYGTKCIGSSFPINPRPLSVIFNASCKISPLYGCTLSLSLSFHPPRCQRGRSQIRGALCDFVCIEI